MKCLLAAFALTTLLSIASSQKIIQSEGNGCDKDWTRIGNNCLRLFLGVKKSWSQAQQFCKILGGRLFEPRVWHMEQRVRGWVVGEIIGANVKWYLKRSLTPWIGVSDIGKEGRWVYASNNQTLNGHFKKAVFSPRQPDNGNRKYKNQDCATYYYPRSFLAKWDDQTCSGKKPVMCEKAPTAPVAITGTGNDKVMSTPSPQDNCSMEFCMKKVFNT